MAIELRAAIPVHHTDTSDAAWDGPATEAAIPNSKGAGTFRAMYAWEDSSADPDTKAAYKFIHHFWSGSPGAASTTASSAGIAILNGGRGGSSIPDSDRRGVYNHLAAHLRDANGSDYTPPPLRSDMPAIEVRNSAETWLDADLEIRATDDGDGMTFEGYAAVFNRDSLPIETGLGAFVERIRPGAFRKSLGERKANIRMFLNHNADNVLATTRAKTLTLEEDGRGLKVRARLPETQAGKDLSTLIKRGDVDSMSFGFAPIRDVWSEDYTRRELVEVRLLEVSPVTGWPAYVDTSAAVRHLAEVIEAEGDHLVDAVRSWLAAEEPLSDADYKMLFNALNQRRGERGIVLPASVLRAREAAAPFMLGQPSRSLSDLAGFLLADEAALQAAINKLANGEPLLQQEAELLEAAIEHLEPPDADEDDMGDMGE